MKPRSPDPSTYDGPLRITEVRISQQDARALKAFVSITLNDVFVIRGLKIIEGMEGTFVAMPARRRKDASFQDVAHPITREFRSYLEARVLEAFEREKESGDGLLGDFPPMVREPSASHPRGVASS